MCTHDLVDFILSVRYFIISYCIVWTCRNLSTVSTSLLTQFMNGPRTNFTIFCPLVHWSRFFTLLIIRIIVPGLHKMELRTNELFKSYLQETVISNTPSPEPQVTKFRDNLRLSENNTINKSISNLCTMMENCQIQLQTSNEIISKLVSPESDFVVIQKTLLKEFFED